MYLRNLWSALLCVFTSRSTIDLLLNIDRVGNALCAGHYTLTISGRVGYFASTKGSSYWNMLQRIIDKTFLPLEGKEHCWKAYQWERSTKYRRGNDVALALLSVVVFIACLILQPIIRLISLFKKL